MKAILTRKDIEDMSIDENDFFHVMSQPKEKCEKCNKEIENRKAEYVCKTYKCTCGSMLCKKTLMSRIRLHSHIKNCDMCSAEGGFMMCNEGHRLMLQEKRDCDEQLSIEQGFDGTKSYLRHVADNLVRK